MPSAEDAIEAFLRALGAPADDPETADTPRRVAALWRENLLSGQAVDPAAVLAETMPDEGGAVVTVTGIPFHAVCPHHLLPVHGVVHLAYAPAGRIVGLGRLEALVAALSRRLVLQERLTLDLAEALMRHLGARGAACAVDAEHLCMVLQGREPRQARVHTRLALGCLEGRADVLPPVPA
jgi:GTP cyclohydrolase I